MNNNNLFDITANVYLSLVKMFYANLKKEDPNEFCISNVKGVRFTPTPITITNFQLSTQPLQSLLATSL